MKITKTCRKCGEEKSIEEFGINKRLKDGRDTWCKNCRREYARSYNLSEPRVLKKRKPVPNRPHQNQHNKRASCLADGRSRWGCIELPKYLELFYGIEKIEY